MDACMDAWTGVQVAWGGGGQQSAWGMRAACQMHGLVHTVSCGVDCPACLLLLTSHR